MSGHDRGVVAARHAEVVRLVREGWSSGAIAAEVGYCQSYVSIIKRRYGLNVPVDRCGIFVDSLAVGLTVAQALDDAGWSNPLSAYRYFLRAGRPVPGVLRAAVSAQHSVAKRRESSS